MLRERYDLDLTVEGLGVETPGGYVSARLGQTARVGNEVRARDQRLRVEAINGLRVARVRLVPAPMPAGTAQHATGADPS